MLIAFYAFGGRIVVWRGDGWFERSTPMAPAPAEPASPIANRGDEFSILDLNAARWLFRPMPRNLAVQRPRS